MKEKKTKKKNWKWPRRDLNLRPNLLQRKKWGHIPLGHSNAVQFLKLIVLRYFLVPLTVFEPSGAVFIMNSKIHMGKNSLNEYFKTISHYFRVYSLSGLIYYWSYAVDEKTAHRAAKFCDYSCIGEERIECVKHARLLGVTIDDRLSFSHHLTDLKRECCKQTEPPEKEFFLEQKRPYWTCTSR